jgi:hypothetical protein
MREIFKQNSSFLLLFIMVIFSSTINAQNDENSGGFNWDGMNGLDNVNVGGGSRSDDSWDHASLYWNTEPNDYGSNYDDYDEPYDWRENNDNSNPPESNTPDGKNIIDKPVITKQELAKLIQDLIGRYTVETQKCVLTTADGVQHTGTIVKFEDRATHHTFYYFTPDTTDGILKIDNYYRIPEPKSGTSTGTDSNLDFTIPGYLDGNRMPVGFNIMETQDRDTPVFLDVDPKGPDAYCQECTHIVPIPSPKYPTLLRLFPKIKDLVFNNPKIWESFSNASGYSRQEVVNFLTIGMFEKLVRVADIDAFGLFERGITPYFVFIREDLVASLETGGYKAGGYNTNLSDTSFFISITILHELVHYARYWNRLPPAFTRNGKGYEAGDVFESDIFGHTLTLNKVTDYAKQYGWNF